MKIRRISIENFKSIDRVTILDINSACILVGKNNTGKSSVIDAVRAILGDFVIKSDHFNDPTRDVVIAIILELDNGEEQFVRYIVSPNGKQIYEDGVYSGEKPPSYLPNLYYIDHRRNLKEFQRALINVQYDESFQRLLEESCMYDNSKRCNQCFECIDDIKKKTPDELNLFEIAMLMEYKLYKKNLDNFAKSVNKHMRENGFKTESVRYEVDIDFKSLLDVKTMIYNEERHKEGNLGTMSAGTKCIYLLSLIEAYVEENSQDPSIVIIEDPEIFLHPQLQKTASEILYRLSKKNQVMFSTYSPNMLFNFSSKQIKQVVLNEDYYTEVIENTDIDVILDDLGYSANDLMNVSFVFIVEGKQDGNRLPMLLEKYYSEIRDDEGMLKRITIVPTNSCTNIKTYANLKYINKLYLKDQFLMIRDSDGKNPRYLVKQLCSYYNQRSKEDPNNLPNVMPKNVLVLKYYSFENYFLDPAVMVKIGVIKSEEEFYNTLYQKYKDYLYKLPCVKRMIRTKNIRINNKEDLKKNMESIKIYVRGHNLFDIFYGKYRRNEEEILRQYIEVAPKENFSDILRAIDSFVYFENRRKED